MGGQTTRNPLLTSQNTVRPSQKLTTQGVILSAEILNFVSKEYQAHISGGFSNTNRVVTFHDIPTCSLGLADITKKGFSFENQKSTSQSE